MEKPDKLDLAALNAAKQYMGAVAWPTVVLGVLVTGAYIATPLLVAGGMLSLWPAMALMAVLTYAAYTVAHEAVHGSISGSNKKLRWLNELMGYMAAWILMIPLTAHRHEHLAHHRNTNEEQGDPDYVVADMSKSPLHALRAAVKVYFGQFRFYMETRWPRASRSQNMYFCLEILVALVPRVAFLAAGFWLEGVLLFLVGGIVGIALLMFLFAYIVHAPHQAVGRYVDTSTIIVPGALGTLVTFAWGFQNYHSIHHLFPRVPFYQYQKLFAEIEPIMLAKGAPVYILAPGGLERRPDAAALNMVST